MHVAVICEHMQQKFDKNGILCTGLDTFHHLCVCKSNQSRIRQRRPPQAASQLYAPTTSFPASVHNYMQTSLLIKSKGSFFAHKYSLYICQKLTGPCILHYDSLRGDGA